jgi:hypothetical protein
VVKKNGILMCKIFHNGVALIMKKKFNVWTWLLGAEEAVQLHDIGITTNTVLIS